MRIIDTHAHLNHEDLVPQIEEILERAHAAAVEEILVVGYDGPSSECAVALSHRYPGLWAAVGLHPYEAARAGEREIARVAELCRDPRVVAIGEIGLDFHGDDFAPAAQQEELLWRQFEIAREYRLPVVIHQRDSGLDILRSLRAFPEVVPIFHCFAGDAELLRQGLALGAYISFAGPLTFKRNDELRALAREVPSDRLLVETDSPYLAPVPHRGKPNEPAYVAHTLQVLAAARGEDLEKLAADTARNACQVLEIGAPGNMGKR